MQYYHYAFMLFEHQMKNFRASFSDSTFTRIVSQWIRFTFHPIQSHSRDVQLIRNRRQQSGKPMNVAKNKKQELGLLHFGKADCLGPLRDVHEISKQAATKTMHQNETAKNRLQ